MRSVDHVANLSTRELRVMRRQLMIRQTERSLSDREQQKLTQLSRELEERMRKTYTEVDEPEPWRSER